MVIWSLDCWLGDLLRICGFGYWNYHCRVIAVLVMEKEPWLLRQSETQF